MATRLTRRSALAAAAAAFSKGPALAATSDSLGAIAARAGLLFGTSIGDEVASDREYAAIVTREARIVTTDVALKFDWIRPDPAGFRFERADAVLGFAQARAIPVRGHTLIWNDNAPDWLKRLSAAETRRVFDDHIERVAGRYAGRLHSWDVVNEPFFPLHGEPGGYRSGPWLAALGPGYVADAFRRVARVDPAARLTLNEAQCENNHEWGRSIRPRLLRLIDELQHAGVPLHAVGLQGHLQPQWPYSDEEFVGFLHEIAARRLDIYVTELDVNDEAFPIDIAPRDAAVAERYARFLREVLSVPAVKMVVAWGLSDRHTWYREVRTISRFSGRRPRPLPYDEDLKAKPARAALAAALGERRV